jgi:hypothetical protein
VPRRPPPSPFVEADGATGAAVRAEARRRLRRAAGVAFHEIRALVDARLDARLNLTNDDREAKAAEDAGRQRVDVIRDRFEDAIVDFARELARALGARGRRP